MGARRWSSPKLPVWLMAPANRLRGWKAGHANGAAFTRKPGIAVTVFFVTHRFGFAEHFRRQQADSTLFLRPNASPTGAATTSWP